VNGDSLLTSWFSNSRKRSEKGGLSLENVWTTKQSRRTKSEGKEKRERKKKKKNKGIWNKMGEKRPRLARQNQQAARKNTHLQK
jgi:hypothetical protein